MNASPTTTAPATYLTASELAALLHVSGETLRRWRADPRYGFPAPVRIGRRLLFKATEVEAYLERHRSEAPGEGA
jgi:excisionase family DNA binding protein